MTPFPVVMAWRETRAAWRHFVYFLICIALGVGALVGVGLFAANVERTVTREARSLMGGDIEIRLSRPISDKGASVLRSLEAQGVETTHVSELVAMASRMNGGRETGRRQAPTQLVELKAIEPGYPLHGALRTIPAGPLREILAPRPCHSGSDVGGDCHGALVQQSLLIKMGVSVGDHIKIGQAYFTVAGTIEHEPDRAASAFSLGPRVMITQAALRTADLVNPGSRVRERHLLRLPAGRPPEPVLITLQNELEAESARVAGFQDAQPQLRRFLNQLTRYLGLVGLTALFVGGIGVASTIHAFLKEKLKTIAILKTVGAPSGTIMRTYLLQTLFLALIGSLLGVGLGLSLQRALPALLAHLFPADLLDASVSQGGVALGPIAKGLLLGVATTLLFALWPLLGIRAIRPALIFRADLLQGQEDASPWRRRWRGWTRDRIRLATALLIATGLMGLAVWQARSVAVGLIFIAALAAAVTILLGASALLLSAVNASPPPSSLALRHAVRNLGRPGSQAPGIMMSVGIGVMVIAAVSLLERSLVRQIGESRPVDAPTFFFIDIQPDQKDGFERLLRERLAHAVPQFTPLVRSRLSAVNGLPVPLNDDDGRERSGAGHEHGKSWYLTREYVLTFLERVPKDNTVAQGRWWDAGARPSSPLVSVEEEAARNLNVGLGSSLEFDIQGTSLAATVSSIRKVEWSNFSTNFYMILSPGSLEGAPFTYVATVRMDPEDEVPVQQAVVEAFPNVTAINIAEVMQTFSAVLEHLSFAIRAVAVFCLLAGAIVMAAALATTRYRRLYESVVFKALGATRTHIAGSFAAEYALMGGLAGLIGIVLANALSWGVLYYVFDLPWSFQPKVLGAAVVSAMVLCVAVGFLTTFRILGEPPLAILRHE